MSCGTDREETCFLSSGSVNKCCCSCSEAIPFTFLFSDIYFYSIRAFKLDNPTDKRLSTNKHCHSHFYQESRITWWWMDMQCEMYTAKFSLVLLSRFWICFHLCRTLLYTSPKIVETDGSAWAKKATFRKPGLCCSSNLFVLISYAFLL